MSEEITYTVDGVDSENGHVTLALFLDRIDHLLNALNGIDRLIGGGGNAKLDYLIIKATHNSALTLTFQPVPKKRTPQIPRDYIPKCHARFFKELRAVGRMEPISPDVEPELREHFRDIALGVGRDFKTAAISNGEERIELDKNFESNAKKLTNEEDCSFGSFEGKLDNANIHGEAGRVWLYPEIGPRKVRCDFMPGTRDQIKEAFGHFVRVVGLKFFQPSNPYPFRIKVKEFEILNHKDQVSLQSLKGIAPAATGEMNAVDFVRQIRNEWD
jgi:hypothetical protein